MAFSTHDCNKNKCTGPKYCGLGIECHNCHAFVFIECIENVKEMECLFQFLDITAHDYASDKQLYKDRNNEKLIKLFSGTFIQFICSNCDINGVRADCNNQSSDKITDLNTKIALLTSSIEDKKKSIESAFDIQKSKLNDFSMNLAADFQSIIESLGEVQCNQSAPVFDYPMVNTRRRGKKYHPICQYTTQSVYKCKSS